MMRAEALGHGRAALGRVIDAVITAASARMVRLDREIPLLEDSDAKLALQGILGLTHRLSDHWDVAVTYRYLWVNEPEPFNLPMDVTKHTVSLGFRYGYDDPPAPPPPPAPAAPPPPPPAPPKQFIIFFGFNKCNITAEADAVLSEAAAAARAGNSASVRIVGHTDTVGSNSYNQKLSECRANAAKSNLAGKGIPEGSISAAGRGEGELAVVRCNQLIISAHTGAAPVTPLTFFMGAPEKFPTQTPTVYREE